MVNETTWKINQMISEMRALQRYIDCISPKLAHHAVLKAKLNDVAAKLAKMRLEVQNNLKTK